MYCLTVPETEESKIKVSAGLVLSEDVRERSAAGRSWLTDEDLLPVCLHTVFPLYVPRSKSPLLIKTPVRLNQTHPNDLILTSLPL